MTKDTASNQPMTLRQSRHLIKPFVQNVRKLLRYCHHYLRWFPRDATNILRFGKDAPKYGDRIFIDPSVVRYRSTAGFGRHLSGMVLDGDWDKSIEPLTAIKRIRIVYEKIETGNTWEECGAYENMKALIKEHPGVDGCYNEEDIIRRYENLSQLIDHLKNGGEFVGRRYFREAGGVLVHIVRDGEIIFGNGGCHRLAIAQKLKLKFIPMQVCVVHKQFLNSSRYRLFKSRHLSPFVRPTPPQL